MHDNKPGAALLRPHKPKQPTVGYDEQQQADERQLNERKRHQGERGGEDSKTSSKHTGQGVRAHPAGTTPLCTCTNPRPNARNVVDLRTGSHDTAGPQRSTDFTNLRPDTRNIAALRTSSHNTTRPQPSTNFTDPRPNASNIAALRTGGRYITWPQLSTDFTDLRPNSRDITELPNDACGILRPNTPNTTDSPTGIRTIVSLRIDTRTFADLRIGLSKFADKSRADPRPTLGATALFQSTLVKPRMGGPLKICG
jgi:hypothetical protein